MQPDTIDRLQLIEADPLAITADALVVEDDGWLTASRGYAAQIDAQYPELRAKREEELAKRGGALQLGAVVPCRLHNNTSPRAVIWSVTWCQAHEAEPRARATPLVIDQVTRRALDTAVAVGARHAVMPALGTRTDQHVLPPVPKKLPRYVMGAAQLIAIGTALAQHPALRVTVCLTQRDLAIWHALLGYATDDDV